MTQGKVLLVERDPTKREDVRLALERAGFQVEATEAVLEGLEDFAPDVVICEAAVGVSGSAMMAQLHTRSPGTPVLVRSELAEPSHAVEAMRHGAFGYLLKSESAQVLAREVHAAIAQRPKHEEERQREIDRAYQHALERKVAAKSAELEALQREHARAEKLAALGTLLAGVVHELGAPLTVLGIDLALVDRLPPGSEASLRALKGAGEATARIERLCNTLRRLTRVGETKGWCDLATALDASKALCLDQLPAQVALEWAIDPSVHQVCLAHDDLVSVVTNLVLNSGHALEARPAGGTISVCLVRTGPRAVLTVRDDGIGIAAENLPRVLDPFFTTRLGKGTGLGLSLVDQIIRNAGGGVTIDSTWGRGTTVSVVLRVI